MKPCVAFASKVITSFLAQKQGRIKAVATGKQSPRSTMDSLEADPIAWSKFIDEEYPKLVEMGVVDYNNSKGYTRKQLEEGGIFLKDTEPVPLGLYHTHHHDKGVNVGAIKGHSGDVTKGIHYSETCQKHLLQPQGKTLQGA